MKNLIYIFYRYDSLGKGKNNFLERYYRYEDKLGETSNYKINASLLIWSRNHTLISEKGIYKFKRFGVIFAFCQMYLFFKKSYKFEDQLSIIVGDNYQSWLLAEFLRLCSRKHIGIQASFHGSLGYSEEKSSLKRFFKRKITSYILGRVDSVRLVNEEQKGELKDKYFEKTIVVPIPLVISKSVRSTMRSNLGFVGRIHTERGLNEWVTIARAVYEKGVISEVVVVGDGPDSENFMKELRKISGLKVISLGYVDNSEINLVFSQIKILLSTAPTETYGMTIREGLAAGLIVIAKINPSVNRLEIESEGLLRTYNSEVEAIEVIENSINSNQDEDLVERYRTKLEIESTRNLENLILSWINLFK